MNKEMWKSIVEKESKNSFLAKEFKFTFYKLYRRKNQNALQPTL